MDRKEALKVLGLKEDATIDEIDKRMNILYRKFRNIEKDENGHTLEDIDKAYRIARGIAYHDPETELRKKKMRENPSFIFRLLKVDEEKAFYLLSQMACPDRTYSACSFDIFHSFHCHKG